MIFYHGDDEVGSGSVSPEAPVVSIVVNEEAKPSKKETKDSER